MENLARASHQGILKIGDLELPCYVLEDGTRVLSQRGLNRALGRPEGGTSEGAGKLPSFIGIKALKPFISKELAARISEPLKYVPPHGGNPANAVPATVLPEICNAWAQAREAGKLSVSQIVTARKAAILAKGLGHIGIIALVDEATGYQKDRPADDLQKILEAYVSKEYLPWTQRFPAPFYEQLFRLNGWQYNPLSVKRPQVVGKMTDNIVYSRLPDGVLAELRRANPKDDKGRRKKKHHQFLTIDIGNPHLEKHLAAVIALMRVSSNWRKFKSLLSRAFPKQNEQFELLETDDD